jgi:hypothetical protein
MLINFEYEIEAKVRKEMQENGNYFENKIKNQVSLVIFSN